MVLYGRHLILLYFQAYIGVAIVYLIMTLTLSRLVAYIERRLAQSDRS